MHHYSNVVLNEIIFILFIYSYIIMKTGYIIDYSYFKDCKKSFWIDYLRLSYRGVYSYWFTELDYDNSHFGYYKVWNTELLVEKVLVKGSGEWYKFTIDFNGSPVPLFMYRLYKWYNLIDFYGSFFRLIELNYLENDYLNVVVACLNCPENASVSRIDYRIDFLSDNIVNTPKLDKVIKHSYDISSVRIWKIWQNLTNRQVWDKVSKGVVFRCYDKLLDSSKKWKDFLYFDYFRYQSVKRLEFECNQKFCKWYTLYTLDALIDKIKSVFCINDQKRLGRILYRSDKRKLTYSRAEIDSYLSYISRSIQKLSINYKSAIDSSEYTNIDIKINPLVVCFDYLEKENDNFLLTHSQVLDFFDYWKKIKKYNKSKWIFID